MIPEWLHVIALISLGVGFLCFIWILFDVIGHPQHMWIMNIVWPVIALFSGPLAVWGYYAYGRLATDSKASAAMERGEKMPSKTQTPFPAMVGKGAAHCGSGCTLGDICAEWLVFFVPAIATWFGWQWLFDDKIFAVWVVDYIFAFGFGVAFQYFTIKPMRNLSPGEGLIQAVKADAASLTSWQLGMYGFMAIAHFWIFGHILNVKLETWMPEFWFMMQIAMLAGFVTAYPVNWWLVSSGIKERM